ESIVFDESPGPDSLHQLFTTNHLAALFYEQQQQIERLRSETLGFPALTKCHVLAIAQESTFFFVQPERSEFIKKRRFFAHVTTGDLSEVFRRTKRDGPEDVHG